MSNLQRLEAFLETLNEYEDILDYDTDCRPAVRNKIELIRLSDEFSIDFTRINHNQVYNFEVGGYARLLKWHEGCCVARSDNGKQPKAGENLYTISFPTGAYIFGDHYPTELFRQFFKELVAYDPEYLDTANKTLYFTSKNAKHIHDDFDDILRKYHDKVQSDKKRIRREQILRELAEMGKDDE